MVAVAYNIKKYLKFTRNRIESMSKGVKQISSHFFDQIALNSIGCKAAKYPMFHS